jgi:hypothetical protein
MTSRAPTDNDDVNRPSGVPAPGRLGASRGELVALLIAVVLFALIVAGFVYESNL